MRGDHCALCGINPALGFASIGDDWYCHAGFRPTCYERAQFLLDGGVPHFALAAMDAIWRDSIGRRASFRAHGTVHTYAGLERRRMRDRARARARRRVRTEHPEEFRRLLRSRGTAPTSTEYSRALRALADRHADEYQRFYEQALEDQGYRGVECSTDVPQDHPQTPSDLRKRASKSPLEFTQGPSATVRA